MKYVYIFIAVIVLLVGGFATVKKVSPVSWGWWGTTNTSSGVAMKGYDPVAYFDTGAPVKGVADYSTEWANATWQFASAEHRDRFVADPEQYAPQFGGYCSFAVSKGFTADISPDAWDIEDGRLYLFADQNVRDEWVGGLPEGTLEKSTANWANRQK
jgi:YHS domain-containing protein